MEKYRFDFEGPIPAKKNKQRIDPRRHFIYKDPDVRAFEDAHAYKFKNKGYQMIEGPFALEGSLKLSTRKDLDGALATIMDTLQKAEVIKNDNRLHLISRLTKTPVKNKSEEEATIWIWPYGGDDNIHS